MEVPSVPDFFVALTVIPNRITTITSVSLREDERQWRELGNVRLCHQAPGRRRARRPFRCLLAMPWGDPLVGL